MADFLKDGTHPLVIVPGFLGCWPPAFAPKSRIDPLTKVYDNLIDALETIGYVRGVSLFWFPFDWRKGVEECGSQLREMVAQIRKLGQLGMLTKTGDPAVPGKGSFLPFGNKPYYGPKVDYSRVDIMAHSMGGLVARAYIQGQRPAGEVARFFTLSAPHRGVVAAYYALEGGDSTKIGIPLDVARNMLAIIQIREAGNFIKSIVGLFNLARGQYQVNLYHEFGEIMPAVSDLLPVPEDNYLYVVDGGQEKGYACGGAPGYPANETLLRLNKPESLAAFNDLDEIWSFSSSAYQTRRRVLVQDHFTQTNPQWRHGEPIQDQPPQNYAPGDTLVTHESGQLPLGETAPDGTPWKPKHFRIEANKEVGHALNHVEIAYDPDTVRLILGCLLADQDGKPRQISAEIWNKPAIDINKIDYKALFF